MTKIKDYHAEYIGFDPKLKGKKAIITEPNDEGICFAQFDDLNLPEAYGWHPKRFHDFKIIMQLNGKDTE